MQWEQQNGSIFKVKFNNHNKFKKESFIRRLKNKEFYKVNSSSLTIGSYLSKLAFQGYKQVR